ncbi:MAG: threonine--tRNA ligase [Patescibacteria group bacterium]
MDQNLEHKRHTLAHLLAASVRELYPGAKNAIGPAIDDGFYQDFELPKPIPEAELLKIESLMRKKLATWDKFEKREVTASEAKDEFAWNEYKTELINEFATEGKTLTFYTVGGFVDLCKGGHVDNPAKDIALDSFKLDRIAGAYWRGDEKKPMLTRIYGLAFDTKVELDAFLAQREKMRERDHRKIGKELKLWVFSDLVGAGLPLYTPKGTALQMALREYLMEINMRYGAQPVTIPHMAKRELYEISGHAAKFGDELLAVHSHYGEFVLKPVNCPHHIQIYASEPRSYRELPIRYVEITAQHRDEKPGEIGGLARTRSFSVDDGHIFCRLEQVEEEAKNIANIVKDFYTSFGMWGNHWVSWSVRDPEHPEKYIGEPTDWDKAEAMLKKVSDEMNLDAKRMEGEAALYGPKLDFMFTDALGRERQLATIQIDFSMPKRFGLEYIDSDGSKKTPIIIHRAICGSLERFMMILIEHFAGAFPFWLSPVQVKVLPVSEKHVEYARSVLKALKDAGLRAEIDDANESLGKKIRNAKTQKIPYLFVLGDKEVEANTVTVENRTASEGAMPLDTIIDRLKIEYHDRV